MRFFPRASSLFCVSIGVCIWLNTATSATAQEANTEHTLRLSEGFTPAQTSIDDFAWLHGYWVGEGLGGQCEEMWGAPLGGAMLGTFRMLEDGQLVFSEFFVLAEKEGQISMKLKHFNPDFDGWEKKDKYVEFKFIKAEDKAAYFDGLTYKLTEDGTLKVYVSMKQKDGTLDEGQFTFTKAG
jgi:hypothetical protein